jgi:hypothetical protein
MYVIIGVRMAVQRKDGVGFMIKIGREQADELATGNTRAVRRTYGRTWGFTTVVSESPQQIVAIKDLLDRRLLY